MRVLMLLVGIVIYGRGAVAQVLTFDSVDTSAGPVDATTYLAGFGITLSGVTAGTCEYVGIALS